jgi:hypothetical protein
MSRRKKDPLRALSGDERVELERVEMERLSRSGREPAAVVAHAKALLAVRRCWQWRMGQATRKRRWRSGGARAALGRCGGPSGHPLQSRCNHEGLAALAPRHGGGPAARYTSVERERILAQVRRPPDHEPDGTATWSLVTLAAGAASRARRAAPGERVYHLARALRGGVALACQDAAGPSQTVPYRGASWEPQAHPARQPHDSLRLGSVKRLT